MKLGFLSKLPKDKLQKVVLVGILTLGASVGVAELYVLPNWKNLVETRTRITTVNDQIQQAEEAARQALKEGAYRAQVKSFVEAQEARMIDGDPFAWIVREITLLAEKHPIRIEGLHAGNKLELSENEKCQPYTARIDLMGSYDEIGKFVADLENSFPVGEIGNLSIAANDEDRRRQEATLDIMLRIRPEQPVAAVEGKKAT
ncbi:MAG TPA: hypothetical protein VL171_19130 [Verrucomicrobiae bacterium]|nr:hypothetical protein [Verrucomicrobiae bacterium]